MSHFCLLSHPESYIAQDWDFILDTEARAYWLDAFAKHFEEVLKHALARYGRTAGKQVMTARAQCVEAMAKLKTDPAALPGGRLNILELCRLRERLLRDNRLGDPMAAIKSRENAAAAKLYPQVVRKARSLRGAEKWQYLFRCIFAGNLFDLGSGPTMHLANQPMDFAATLEKIPSRPWLVDDYDRLLQDLPAQPPTKWSKAIVFVDNAGCDFILGVMPLVRELVRYGTKVVLAANELPSINDMTADETADVVRTLAGEDDDLAAMLSAGMFEVVSTGTDIPQLDLSNVSDELNAAAADADLLLFEGMGRAIESNYFNTVFKVDTINVALLKDPWVAGKMGGKLYDCICRYTPATA